MARLARRMNRRAALKPAHRNVLKRRPRADDAARTVDCLHRCADCRADRAVLYRLESVPAAIRDRGDASGRRAGARRRRTESAATADTVAAVELGGWRTRRAAMAASFGLVCATG